MADFYELLEVDRGASGDDIKRAYRQKARELHPDRNSDESAQVRMAEVNTAYETLSDPERRAHYDRYGDESGPQASPFGAGGGLGDIFEAFFGGNGFGQTRSQAGPARGVDLETNLNLEFEAAVFGAREEVTIRTAVHCEVCEASGAAPGTHPTACADCNGTGQLRRVRQSILGQMVSASPCPRCSGSGQEIHQRCEACKGEGRKVENRTFTVEIPGGVDDGTTLRLSGRGAVGPRGGPAGDLYVHIKVRPHDRFRRQGSDLVERLPISFTQAALGARLTYETLDSSEELEIVRGTQTGTVLRLRGRGVPDVQGRGGRGDLLVELVLHTPTDLDAEDERILREWAGRRGEDVAPTGGFVSKLRSAFR